MAINLNETDKVDNNYKAGYRLFPGFWFCVIAYTLFCVERFWFGLLALKYYLILKNSGQPEYASFIREVQPKIVFGLIFPIIGVIVLCIYFSKIWSIVKNESLLITPTNIQFLSRETPVRSMERKDISALRYLNVGKGARHIRIYTVNDAITIPRYVLYDDTETINLIRKYAELTEKQVGFVWIRCKRSDDSTIPTPTS